MTIPTREEALKALDKISSDYDLAGGWSPDPMPLLATLRSYIESHTDTALTEALTRVEKLEKYKSPQQWAKLKSEVTAYRNEAEQSRVLLDQADTREKIAVSDIYDRDNIIRDLLKKVRDHEARIEKLEGAIQTHFEALDRHDKSSDGFGKSRETYVEVMGTLHVLRHATLSKGIAE